MANALVVSDFNPKFLNDKLIINDISDCEFCLNMKGGLQIMQEQLSSARLIIKLLHSEGKIVNAIDTTTNQEMN